MKVGASIRLTKRVTRGECRRLRGPGVRTCWQRTVVVRATRFG
ncbi:hypothetical protein Q5424_17770 [Conexibacter sp. JD483]|nr:MULTISPECIES: hypothetical protein [unclassified Conexibacter]MDO8188734.1 hypothetical protein [Conexibacter sp. CPCC 205706]MDO8201261.1 hypothetical protein [Conexibacter sp. CPCC 205762]MDR9370949.1 hypothetical protein [Conexibacter sp. JD483]